jgi:hypothetical protein
MDGRSTGWTGDRTGGRFSGVVSIASIAVTQFLLRQKRELRDEIPAFQAMLRYPSSGFSGIGRRCRRRGFLRNWCQSAT